MIRGRDVFRGKLASASLKRREPVALTVLMPCDVFRGKLASASLKPPLVAPPYSSTSGIPRQACLGLIEAFSPSVPPWLSIDASIPRQACLGLIEASAARIPLRPRGNCIPRQACLGLIEASSAAAWSTPRVPVFRGKLASASLKPATPSATTSTRTTTYSEASLPRPH